MTDTESLKDFLDAKVDQYNHPHFLTDDPLGIPHRYRDKEDIEIAAFLTATIAWGNRKSIIKNASAMLEPMGSSPYEFILNHQPQDLHVYNGFVHRTFQEGDLKVFLTNLQRLYQDYGGMESVFHQGMTSNSMQPAISYFKEVFFQENPSHRSTKHVSDPLKGSAAKRMNMFLRWMVRKDDRGVDFGIWRSISPSVLSVPLDIHVSRTARILGLLSRKQDDAKALQELDTALRKLDPSDPAKYDFALFGLGVFEKFAN